MKYHQLQVEPNKSAKRVGRGISAGQGKTAGRGTKGQNSRAGSSKKPGFEGGQNPLMQRLPKLRGFKSHRTPAEIVFTQQLEQFSGKTITNELLAESGLVSSPYVNVKVLNRGELSKKVTVKLQAASQSAVSVIQKAGGNFESVERVARPKTEKKSEPKTTK